MTEGSDANTKVKQEDSKDDKGIGTTVTCTHNNGCGSVSSLTIAEQKSPMLDKHLSNRSQIGVHSLSREIITSPSKHKLEFIKRVEHDVPNNLKRLELIAALRSREHQNDIAQLEDRQSSWESRLAKMKLNRQTEFDEIAKNMRKRIQDCADDILKKNSAQLPNYLVLEKNFGEIERKAHKLVTSCDAVLKENFDENLAPHVNEMSDAIKMEVAKCAREEGILMKRYETHVGNAARFMNVEEAAMKAEHALFEESLRNGSKWKDTKESLFSHSLEEIETIKMQLINEKNEREYQDEVVVDKFLYLQSNLQSYVMDRMEADGTRRYDES